MSMRSHIPAGLPLAIGTALLFAGCSGSPMKTGPSPIAAGGSTGVIRQAERGKVEVCKDYSGVVGPSVLITVVVDVQNDHSTSNDPPPITTMLGDGACAELWTANPFQSGADFATITETVPTGYTASWVRTRSEGGTEGPIAGNVAQGFVHSELGQLIVFTNTSNPAVLGDGRFTGGTGSVDLQLVNGVTVSSSLTIHCDKILSNNLNVVWKDSNAVEHHFHMEDHLTTIECSDDPNIDQKPPDAPLDTMRGTGIGTFDGDDGWTVEFTFVDTGEGGGKNDKIALKIFKGSTIVLQFSLTDLDKGNLQAHFDQPHG